MFSSTFVVQLILVSSICATTPTPTATYTRADYSQLSDQINSLTQILGVSADTTPTITSPVDALAGIPTPPPGVAQEIMTGIPQSAFANVMNPAARQSVLSDWSAGHPPAWYTSLSPDAKSYLSEVQAVGYQLVSGTRRVATATSKKAAAQSLKVPGIVGFGVTVFALLFFL